MNPCGVGKRSRSRPWLARYIASKSPSSSCRSAVRRSPAQPEHLPVGQDRHRHRQKPGGGYSGARISRRKLRPPLNGNGRSGRLMQRGFSSSPGDCRHLPMVAPTPWGPVGVGTACRIRMRGERRRTTKGSWPMTMSVHHRPWTGPSTSPFCAARGPVVTLRRNRGRGDPRTGFVLAAADGASNT